MTDSAFDSELYTEIPSKITTPDVVETRIGTLEFFDGLPTAETAEKTFDNLDFLRGVEVFLDGITAASLEAVRLGMLAVGVDACNKVTITDELMDSQPLFLTGNTDTVYAAAILDLERDGPTVVEVPPGCGPGTVNDAWFRFVVDMGAPGPDRGQGGKYLILPPEYDGPEPDGYFIARSPSYINALVLRGFLVDGKPDAAAELFREGIRIYPLSQADNPPSMVFINISGVKLNTIHANDFEFYEELSTVIHREPIGIIDPETRGRLASIGIRKDQPFAPDDRLRATLVEAAAVGNASARAMLFHPRDSNFFVYEGSSWQTAFVGGDYRWLIEDGLGGRNLDARSYFFYMATVNTPAMALKMVGAGSQYALNAKDENGAFLYGDRGYKLNIPADVPAKDFWSIVVYDPQTRSELQTGQPFPSRNNKKDDLAANADGSIDIYFGPEAPEGLENNWIETVPGKGWFILLRLYGPLEPWFDKTWRPGEIQPID